MEAKLTTKPRNIEDIAKENEIRERKTRK